ncbi:phosphatidate phosphatase PAH1-like isoform X2 [Aristolochia californica]|uniref:phosphatidate phosphatase PAH1-like isoform X2 n=1 Tax=Aristolochia californica TaxID=171875 RepID=UPI0035DA2851
MNVVGRVGSIISQGVYSVATPFHPFGGAVDIIVVEQQDGTFRSTPWYVRFGKFQGVLKGAEKNVKIIVNGVEANFHMNLDNSGEAYFVREIDSQEENESYQDFNHSDTMETFQEDNTESTQANENSCNDDFEASGGFHDHLSEISSTGTSEYGAYHYESLDHVENIVKSQGSEVVLVSGDGHVLLAPISLSDSNNDNLQLSTPHFNLYPGEAGEVAIDQLHDSSGFTGSNVDIGTGEDSWEAGLLGDIRPSNPDSASKDFLAACDDDKTSKIPSKNCAGDRNFSDRAHDSPNAESCCSEDSSNMSKKEIFKSCLEFSKLTANSEENVNHDSHSLTSEWNEHGGAKKSSYIHLAMENEKAMLNLEIQKSENAELSEPNAFCNSSSPTEIQKDASENTDGRDKGFKACEDSDSLEQKGEQLGGAQDLRESRCWAEIPKSQPVDARIDTGIEVSLCGNLLHAGMGLDSATEAFNAHRVTKEKFMDSGASITKNENLIVRYRDRYLPWDRAASILLGMVAFGLDFPAEPEGAIPVEQDEQPKVEDQYNSELSSTRSHRWRLWPIPFRRTKTLQHSNSNASSEDIFLDTESGMESPRSGPTPTNYVAKKLPEKKLLRTNIPTSEEIASLNLKDGQNKIAFSFSTRVLGEQQWNARIVISDVDGTITKSDVLGQFMPLLGKDWTQSGVARLFSAIKENGYQLLFLSARAIVQAYLTRNFLLNLKQDGKGLPNGPVVISPNGLFPSLYREVIRRKPQEFKIACLEDIRALFPSDYNPFYAGFGNRDTDEISYLKIGIPKGKIFIINPKGEVAIHQCIDAKSYISLHTLVNDMFPPTSLAEQEAFNSWNYWRTPLPTIDC